MSLETFIPKVWSAKLLVNLRKYLVYGASEVINTDYEGEITDVGDTVKIHAIGPVTVSSYTKNVDMAAPQTLSDAESILTIDQAKSFNFQVDDIDAAQQKPKVMSGAMDEASYAIRDTIDQFIAAKYADADSANAIGTDGSPKTPNNTANDAQNCYNLLVDLNVALTNAKIPTEGRFVVVTPAFYGLLLKEDRFVHATSQGDQVVANGLVGRAAGFNVMQSHNAPKNGANWKIIAGHKMAWSFAQQINKVEPYRMEKRFADAVKGLSLYGAKVVRPAALAVLTSTL